MKRRSLLLAGLSLSLVYTSAAAVATSVVDPLQSASLKALEWFKALASSLSDIVSNEERLQLISSLERVAGDLYNVELQKREVLASMEGQKPDVDHRILELREGVSLAQRSLGKVALHLREQYRQQGADVERELTKALYDRNAWTASAMSSWQDPSQRPGLIERGKRTVEALRSANVQLSRLIADLKALPAT